MARSCKGVSRFELLPLWEQVYPQNAHNMDSFIVAKQTSEDELNEDEYILESTQQPQAQYLEYTYGHVMAYHIEHIFSSRTLT